MNEYNQPLFKTGHRIIRVIGSLPSIRIGDKVIAGVVSENGRLVTVNGFTYRTCYFKPLLTCKGNCHEEISQYWL